MTTQDHTNMHIIENARAKDAILGDHLTWVWKREVNGMTVIERREGIFHHRDAYGMCRSEDGRWITYGEGDGITLTIRREKQPDTIFQTRKTVIIPADNRNFIEAVVCGKTWRTQKAVLGIGGYWYGIWTSDSEIRKCIAREKVIIGTWKVRKN